MRFIDSDGSLRLVRTYSAILALIVDVIFGAHASLAQTSRGSPDSGSEISGRWCSECHSTGATRMAPDVGPTFQQIAQTRTPEYIRNFLAGPHVRKRMPPFDLSMQEIDDIVAYMQTLK